MAGLGSCTSQLLDQSGRSPPNTLSVRDALRFGESARMKTALLHTQVSLRWALLGCRRSLSRVVLVVAAPARSRRRADTALAALIVALWVVKPDDISVQDAARLLPDLVRLLKRLAADPSMPCRIRIELALLLGCLALPIDLIPDFIPVVGYADDAIIVAIVCGRSPEPPARPPSPDIGQGRRRDCAPSACSADSRTRTEPSYATTGVRRVNFARIAGRCGAGYAPRVGDERADLADAMQADAFRDFFARERAELVAKHAKLVRMGDTRREIVRVETDIRHIDRMVEALERRFPVSEVSRGA